MERIEWNLIVEFWIHSLINLIEDFLSKLKQKDLSFIFRIRLILNHINVRDIGQLSGLITNLILKGLVSRLPQPTIEITHRVILTQPRAAQFNIPPIRSLKRVPPIAGKMHRLWWGSRKKPNNGRSIPRLVGRELPIALFVPIILGAINGLT